MAARAPTALDLTLDESLTRPRQFMAPASMDTTLDNQERLVDMPRLMLVDPFICASTDSASFQRMAGRYYFRSRDTMGTGTVTDAIVYVLSRSSSAGTANDDFQIRLSVSGDIYVLNKANGDTA